MLHQKLLPEGKQCPTEGRKNSLPRESSSQGISSKGKMATASAPLKSSSSFCLPQVNIRSSNEGGPRHELGLPFPADLIRHPQTDTVLMALEKLDPVALRDANVLVRARIKMQFLCVSSVHTTLSVTIVPPFPSPVPSKRTECCAWHCKLPFWLPPLESLGAKGGGCDLSTSTAGDGTPATGTLGM